MKRGNYILGELLLKIGLSAICFYLFFTVFMHYRDHKKHQEFNKSSIIFYRKILYCIFCLFAIVMMWVDYNYLSKSIGLIGAGVLLAVLFFADMFIIQGAKLKKFGLKEVEFGQEELQNLKEVVEISNELITENDQTMNAIRQYLSEQSRRMETVFLDPFLKNFNRIKFQVNVHEFGNYDSIIELVSVISEQTWLECETVHSLLNGNVYYDDNEMKAYIFVSMNAVNEVIELESHSEKLNENDINSILMLYHIYYFMNAQREGLGIQ
ncbi:type II toxin-antitoxin system SpoIISA family toxin [Bacillus sp. EAC]|uniref:type II toxin-antitoxin system SpoIISA family toxin n=1 Tax=Bacillus sp. EAC TaxID=1978338 RepID=UPI0011551EA6|nr:type II toxin-antitoxin system SpoIISA family toxin [Bacillus sp. EAC]